MSKEIQQNNQEYGADQIQILEGLEAVIVKILRLQSRKTIP